MEGSDRLDQADFGYAGGDLGNGVGAFDERGHTVSAEKDRAELGAGAARAEESAAGPGLTGWETERAILYADETARRVQAQAQGQVVDSNNCFTGELGAVAFGLGALASLIEEQPVEDDVWRGSDRKTLAKEIEKKEELGMKM